MLSNYYFYRLYVFYKGKNEPFPFLFSVLNTALFIAAVLSPVAEIIVYLVFAKQFSWFLYFFLIVCCPVILFYNKNKTKIMEKYQNHFLNKVSFYIVAPLYGLIMLAFAVICIFVNNEIHWYFERGELIDYFTI